MGEKHNKKLYLMRKVFFFVCFFFACFGQRENRIMRVFAAENQEISTKQRRTGPAAENGVMISNQGYFDVEVRSEDGKVRSSIRVNITVTPNPEDTWNKNAPYPNAAHNMQQKITWTEQCIGKSNPFDLRTEQDECVLKSSNITYTLHGSTTNKNKAYNTSINHGSEQVSYMERAYTVFPINFSYVKSAYTYPEVSYEGRDSNVRFSIRKYVLDKKKKPSRDDDYIGLPDSAKSIGWYGGGASSSLKTGVFHQEHREEFSMQINMAQTGVYLYGGQTEPCHAKLIITLKYPALEIIYRKNGATEGKITETKTVTYNEADDLHNFSAFHLAKTGFRKKDGAEWNTNADGTGISFGEDVPYTAVQYLDFTDGEEFEDKSLKVYAQWERICTVTLLAGEGIESVSGGGTYKPGESVTVSAAVHGWYDFEYWAGESESTDNPYTFTMPEEDVSLTATATNGRYKIEFNSNGGDGYIEPVYPALIGMDVTLPDVAVTHDFTHHNEYGESLFLGWNRDAMSSEIEFESGETVPYLSEEHEGTITLYAVWDTCPGIMAKDRYFTLKQAQSGVITREELMSRAMAEDREDGLIPPGTDAAKNTCFEIIDYTADEFTGFTGTGSAVKTYLVRDGAGNTYQKEITVYVVDTMPKEVSKRELLGTTRFISQKYYNKSPKDGGLEEDSIWRVDKEYRAALEKGLSNLEKGTPAWVYRFSYGTLQKMKEYIREYGVENSRSPQFLSDFYHEFF